MNSATIALRFDPNCNTEAEAYGYRSISSGSPYQTDRKYMIS